MARGRRDILSRLRGNGMERRVREIDLKRISPNFRYLCDEEAIVDLSGSIRRQGQLEPIHIWFVGDEFRILDGEKRWRACKKLGLTSIRAVIIQSEPGSWLC